MARALASGIEGADVENKERKYQQEQARIDLELLQIQSDAASGITTWEVAQTRSDQWVKNNHSRLQKQAALAAELDQLSPLPADPARSANSADGPLPPGTPQAARFQTLEQQEAQAMDKIPKKATPEERQHLIDVWTHSKEGAEILQEKKNNSSPPKASAALPSHLRPRRLPHPEPAWRKSPGPISKPAATPSSWKSTPVSPTPPRKDAKSSSLRNAKNLKFLITKS